MIDGDWLAVMAMAVSATTGIGIPVLLMILKFAWSMSGDVSDIKARLTRAEEHEDACDRDRRGLREEIQELTLTVAKTDIAHG